MVSLTRAPAVRTSTVSISYVRTRGPDTGTERHRAMADDTGVIGPSLREGSGEGFLEAVALQARSGE